MESESKKKKRVSDYNKGYYERNKEKLSEARKKKYHEDKEHREKIKENSREYRERNRKLEGFVGDLRGRKKGPLPPMEHEINGKKVKVYTTGYMARYLGMATSTLRSWIKKGLIPETGIWISNRRYWTRQMMDAVKTAIEQCSTEKVGQYKNSQFSELVMSNWPKEMTNAK